MSWQFLAFSNALMVAVSVLFIRSAMRHKFAGQIVTLFNGLQHLFQYLVILAFLPFAGHIDYSTLSRYWLWIVGGGLAFALTNLFYNKLLSYLDAGISAVLGTMNVPLTLVLSAAILHEKLRLTQLLGAVLLYFAILYVLILARRHSKHHTVRRPWLYGLIFAVLSAVFLSTAQVNEKYLLEHMNTPTYLLYGVGGQCLMSFVLAARRPLKQFKIMTHHRLVRIVLIVGLLRGLSGLCSIYAQKRSNNLAEVVSTTNFRLVLVVLLSAWILKERQRLKEKLLAAFAALGGMLVIFWK